jgi:hypothetical protein
MNYPPNTQRWQHGAFVLHDKDRKEANMLMVVQGYDRVTGACITRYVQPDVYQGMRGRFKNDVKYLHDPARFGLEVPA